ncbi:unnamed protein product [Cylindrotheca closterium]|uniref:DUF6824 domain-containing protein n=1 Tax=Cylindrotheca closterium TaxID=2856 RepID=A0AAD2G6C8_9STRA|nr:unnamed protein product [Cylindrotheca closterium]
MMSMDGNEEEVSQRVATNDLLPNDVLLGRGTGPNEHLGNCLFRDEVESHKDAYVSAPDKATEDRIVDAIISSIYQNRGRFLKKMDSQQDLSGKPVYEVVLDKKVLAYKIKQAIRYSKRKDKKFEASKDGKDGSESKPTIPDSSAQLQASLSSPWSSRNDHFRTPPNALSSDSERLLLMAQNASVRTSGIAQQSQLSTAQQILAQQQRFSGSQALVLQNPLVGLEQRSAALDSDTLDRLAILHLHRTDPVAAQLVLDRRRRQEQEQASQLDSLSLQQQLRFAAATAATMMTEQHHLLQERNAPLGMPQVQQSPSRSAFAGSMRNPTAPMSPAAGQQRQGLLGTSSSISSTLQDDARKSITSEDSEESASKRRKTNHHH